ncbi:universal stress protein [Nocardioides speluncae]|uniref:universal stress protein n=1 Tax=Nocardioides speluncae TaxID=2670337 RepID=UPI001F0C73CF|nr:universal stress protein [Nocardioides speluncae]
MSGTIVVGWSADKYGAAAVEHAVAEARLRSASVVVVNATRGDALVDDRYARSGDVAVLESSLADSGVPFEVRQSMGPDVADQVLDVADEVGATLIVVGLRHRTPVGKLVMGSVAQRILLGATCPVLAVKPS